MSGIRPASYSLENVLLDAVIATVPQWYECEQPGLAPLTLQVRATLRRFYSRPQLSPPLVKLLAFASAHLDRWYAMLSDLQPASATELVQERLAVEWLHLNRQEWVHLHPGEVGVKVDWAALLRHAYGMTSRTHENEPASFNFVIANAEGRGSILDPSAGKLLDPIGASRNVYLRVNGNLDFVSYEEVAADWRNNLDNERVNPEFLQPFASELKDGEYSVHLTRRGDFVITTRTGMLASRRKGRWHLYDVPNLTSGVRAALSSPNTARQSRNQDEPEWLAPWLLQLAFDLSYRRHGALLVYDPARSVLPRVTNPAARFVDRPATAGDWHALIGSCLGRVGLEDAPVRGDGNVEHSAFRRRFLELASLDGAILFDADRILAFAAMIQSFEGVGNHAGARTTAAHSAYLWGGVPIKISADGDITILFNGGRGDTLCQAAFTFL